jgi:hypothetical protein
VDCAEKVCTKCHTCKLLTEFSKRMARLGGYQSWCKSCTLESARGAYAAKVATGWKDTRSGYRTREALRDLIFEAYGRQCSCCGESEERFLTLDHIGGGGRKHLKERGGNGYQMLLDVIRQGFPKDKYRVLCMSCNMAERYGHLCPHRDINVAGLIAGMAC